jgi:hypothetical protein
MADFPTSIKTWADLADNSSPANSSDINSAYAEITAIENALLSDTDTINSSTDLHGLLPKLDGSSDNFLNGKGLWAAPQLDDLAIPEDSTDLDASTLRHGLMMKYPGTSTIFLSGAGVFASLPNPTTAVRGTPYLIESSDVLVGTTDTYSGIRMISLDNLIALLASATTDFDVKTTTHGFMPKLDGSSDHFLNGKGEWVTLTIP